MDNVVDLRAWRADRASPEGLPTNVAPGDGGGQESRLERAVRRLDELTASSIGGTGPVSPGAETELLAVLGELSMGLVDEATNRAERLADTLSRRRVARRGGR